MAHDDVDRAAQRHRQPALLRRASLGLDRQDVAAQDTRLRDAIALPPAELERQARRFTHRLVLTAQACLMIQHASAEASAAFIGSRFDPNWCPVTGITAGTSDPAALPRAAWQ